MAQILQPRPKLTPRQRKRNRRKERIGLKNIMALRDSLMLQAARHALSHRSRRNKNPILKRRIT